MLHDIRIFCGDMQLLILAIERYRGNLARAQKNVERLKRECSEKKKKKELKVKKKKKI